MIDVSSEMRAPNCFRILYYHVSFTFSFVAVAPHEIHHEIPCSLIG